MRAADIINSRGDLHFYTFVICGESGNEKTMLKFYFRGGCQHTNTKVIAGQSAGG